jgi:hypothetical protein
MLDVECLEGDVEKRFDMNRRSFLTTTMLAAATAVTSHAAEDTRCFEMRVYHTAPGKLDALHARFRDHTCKLFEKHKITSLGYWIPVDAADQRLHFVLAYPSREAREASWKAFLADPDWQAAQKASEANGKLVEKADVTFMTATDFSPEVKPSSAAPRIFELRTYTTTPGNLDRLLARFRNHTCKLFAKYGMTNLFYWKLMPDQKGAENTLVYFLAHKDVDAAKASFTSFRGDPDWKVAREASEKEGGGSLTVPDGVKSLMLKATDYSPTK